MGKKRLTALTISAATLLTSAGIITAATYALFTDTVTLKNHLTGGNLEITLKRTNLKYTYIDSEGIQQFKEDTTEVDFSAPTTENVFGFKDTDKFVPTDYRTATMQLSNASTVAYGYYLEVKLTSSSNKFAEQLKIDVDTDPSAEGGEYTAMLSEGLDVGSAASPIAQVKVGSTTTFTIKVSFIDDEANNDAMELTVDFDLIVHAIQKTA